MAALFQPFVPKATGLVLFWMEGSKHEKISSFLMNNIQFMVNMPPLYWLDILPCLCKMLHLEFPVFILPDYP